MAEQVQKKPELKQNLHGWMIFFIAISSVIGSGIFSNGGSAIEIAGPGGTLVALVVMGLIAICAAESLSELTQLFPAANAIVEYVRAFVDKDLGWVVGIAYWYTYASIFAGQNLVAANLATYWGLPKLWQIILFYIVSPLIMIIINMVGCATFGWVEAVGGILKIALVVGTTIILYIVASEKEYWTLAETSPMHDGFQYNQNVTSSNLRAICYIIPIVAFGFLGMESIAVTAFEARSSRSLRFPSQIIAYVTFVMYLLCLLGQCLNIQWDSAHLPPIYGGIADGVTNTTNYQNPSSTSLTIVTIWNWGYKSLAGFLNGAMIFSVLSAGNTSLYISSRTLYGLALRVAPKSRIGRAFSAIEPKTGVPNRSLWLSALAFCWLPFLNLIEGYEVQYLIEIIQISASISGLLVWAALSLAYLRYFIWLKICDKELKGIYLQYRRKEVNYKPFTFLAQAQPFPAIIAIVGCLVILAFTSATWWDTKVTFSKVAVGFTAPIIFLNLFIIFKLINRRKWVRLTPNFTPLSQALVQLKWYKSDEISPQDRREQAIRSLSPRLAPQHSAETIPLQNL